MTNERKVRERSINVTNLFLYIRRKWRMIIVGTIGIAIIFSAFMWFWVQKANVDGISETNLTEDEAAFVEKIEAFSKIVDCRKSDIEDSVLMQIDPLNKDMVILEYIVSCDNNQEVVLENKLANIYREKIRLLLLDEAWNQNLKIDGVTDLKGLVEVADPVDSLDTIIKINISYTNMESCKMIAQRLQEQVDSLIPQMADEFGAHQIILLSKTEGVFIDTNLAALQNTVYTNYNTYKAQLDQYLNQMSDGQKRIYFGNETAVTAPVKKSFGVKYVLLGGILGFILMIGIIGMLYILQDKIRFVGELEGILPLCFLGVIKNRDNQNISSNQQEEKELINNIELLCKRVNNFVVHIYADENEFSTLTGALERIHGSQIEMKRIDKAEEKGGTCLVQVENVIVMETLNQSHMLKMAKFIDLCEQNDVHVLGTIMVVA